MAHQATSRRVAAGASIRALTDRARASESLRAAWTALVWSRLAILAVAVFAALSVGEGGVAGVNAERFDDPALTHPYGGLGDAVASPLARWDSVWYLRIADAGYPAADSPTVAFFPLYPLLTRAVAGLGGGHPATLLAAGYIVSIAALLAALVLLYRLTALELGRRLAAPTLLLVCVFPASLFFGAPYSESLFLLASVAALYAARTGHWAWAGMAGAAASGTRSAGILLLVPLALLYLYGPRRDRPPDRTLTPGGGWLAASRPTYRLKADAGWLVLAGAGLGAYAAYLGLAHGDPLAFASVQDFWGREFRGPLEGIWQGLVAGFEGARQLASGAREPVYFDRAGGDPFRVAALNLMLLATLAFALWGTVGVVRRLPLAYGAYVVAALLLALSFPVGPQPLMSLPRFVAVLFPIFMWLALACEERRITDRVALVFAIGLGLFVTQFAGWQFVA